MITNNVSLVMTRVRAATPMQPLSVFVFVDDDKKKQFDVRFTRTAETQRMIKARTEAGNPVHQWLGDFDWTLNNKTIRAFLKTALKGA